MTYRMRLAGLGALPALLWACGELPSQPTGLRSDQLMLYALLNPDSARHRVDVAPVDANTTLRLTGVKATIHRQNPATRGWTLVAEWDSARAAAAGGPFYGKECLAFVPEWPVSLGPRLASSYHQAGTYCMRPEAVLEPGATYRVAVEAVGRTRAVGETRVVGGFKVERAIMSSTAKSHSLEATWSESKAAHLYFVGLRRRFGNCSNCDQAWYAEVEGTSFEGKVPQRAVDIAGEVPMLDMLAVDRHFHAYLTTGDGGNLHEVHPVQNVVGGYGVVGSYLHRSREIKIGAGSAGQRVGHKSHRPAGPDRDAQQPL